MSQGYLMHYNGFELECGPQPTEGGYAANLVVRGDMGIATSERQIYLDAEPFATPEGAAMHAVEQGKAWVNLRV